MTQLMQRFIVLSLLSLTLGCQNSKSDSELLQQEAQTETAPVTADEPSHEGPPPKVESPEKWNYPDIPWTTSQEGLKRIKESGRPGLVVLQGEWCPHCRNYAEVFQDPEIEFLSKSFEVILVDDDTPEGDRFRETGNYVPRTLFLRPDGSVDTSLSAPNPKFPHFFSVRDKTKLTEAMKTAIARYGT